MFIELIEPEVVDLYATKDRVKLRLREKGAPGRIWLSLTYNNLEQAKSAMHRVLGVLEAGVKESGIEKEIQVQIGG